MGGGGVIGMPDAQADVAGRMVRTWPCLVREEVHLWRAPLDLGQPCLARLREVLPAEERALALTLRFQWDRDRFVATRGWLRLLLGRYLGAPPGGLRFVVQANGKPALAEPAIDVRFNVALAGPVALMAVAEGREVGVGVEPIPESTLGLEASRAGPRRPPPDPGTRTVLEDRARRGAYQRARGRVPSAGDRRRPAWPPASGGDQEPAGWSFHPVDAGSGYAGALALEGVVRLVRHLDCDPRWLDGRLPC